MPVHLPACLSVCPARHQPASRSGYHTPGGPGWGAHPEPEPEPRLGVCAHGGSPSLLPALRKLPRPPRSLASRQQLALGAGGRGGRGSPGVGGSGLQERDAAAALTMWPDGPCARGEPSRRHRAGGSPAQPGAPPAAAAVAELRAQRRRFPPSLPRARGAAGGTGCGPSATAAPRFPSRPACSGRGPPRAPRACARPPARHSPPLNYLPSGPGGASGVAPSRSPRPELGAGGFLPVDVLFPKATSGTWTGRRPGGSSGRRGASPSGAQRRARRTRSSGRSRPSRPPPAPLPLPLPESLKLLQRDFPPICNYLPPLSM